MVVRQTIVVAVAIAAALGSAKGVVSYAGARAANPMAAASATPVAALDSAATKIVKGADGHYDVAVSTANGATRAARVDLLTISVAGARVDHVAAMVVKDGLSSSLLGMTYLGRLSRFEATPTSLVLQR